MVERKKSVKASQNNSAIQAITSIFYTIHLTRIETAMHSRLLKHCKVSLGLTYIMSCRVAVLINPLHFFREIPFQKIPKLIAKIKFLFKFSLHNL